MKKYSLLAACLLLVAAVSCKTNIKTLEDYQAWSMELQNSYNEETLAVYNDSTLTDDEKMARMEELYETTTDEFAKTSVDFLKRNNGSAEIASAVLENVSYMLEVDELESLLASLTGEAASCELVSTLKQTLESKKATAEGQMFTDFTVVQDENDPEGSTVKFSDYVGKGKYMLVDFWASWCGPCKAEIPNIIAVYEKYKGDDFDVLSVAVWDEPEDTKAAAVEHGVVWNQIINADKIPTDIYGIEGIPHIMLIGPDGTILKRDLRGAAIEEAVSEALGR